MYDARTWTLIAELQQAHNGSINALVPLGSYLFATAASDHRVKLWTATPYSAQPTGQGFDWRALLRLGRRPQAAPLPYVVSDLRTLRDQPSLCVHAVSPTSLAIGYADGLLVLWTVRALSFRCCRVLTAIVAGRASDA